MNKLKIIFILTFFPLNILAECNDSIKKEIKDRGTLLYCESFFGMTDDRKKSFILSISNIQFDAGVTVKVFASDNLKKPIWMQDGLGEILDTVQYKGASKKLLIKDLNGDGIKEWMFKTMSERSSALFAYTFDTTSNTFKSIKFNSKYEGKNEESSMLVGSIDHPIKVSNKAIDVYYEKSKYYRYYYKNGSYHLK